MRHDMMAASYFDIYFVYFSLRKYIPFTKLSMVDQINFLCEWSSTQRTFKDKR